MPYKVNRLSNSSSKRSSRREIPVVESPVVEIPDVESPVVEIPVVEITVVESPVVESPVVESPVVESPVVECSVVESPVLDPLVEETFDVPLDEEQSLFPMFNDDFSKAFNPLSNRYVKVGGDIDQKINLSKRY